MTDSTNKQEESIMSFLGGKVGPSTSHRVWEIRDYQALLTST